MRIVIADVEQAAAILEAYIFTSVNESFYRASQ